MAFAVGDIVTIHNLHSALGAPLNGQQAVVESAMVTVRLSNGESVLLPAANVVAREPAQTVQTDTELDDHVPQDEQR